MKMSPSTVQKILNREEVYSGCYARVSINFYAFNSNGNRGIACGLGNIQKVRDGERLSGRTDAASDFEALDDAGEDGESVFGGEVPDYLK